MIQCSCDEITEIYQRIFHEVSNALGSFDAILMKRDKSRLIWEFIFCLLTPQSKARKAQEAVDKIVSRGLADKGDAGDIKPLLMNVRFYNNKASYIVRNRDIFLSDRFFEFVADFSISNRDIRDYLVKRVIGFGYKEASHFLRNIGRGHDIAILDRHILKGLCELGCIYEFPESINRRTYLDIEQKMLSLSHKMQIDVRYMDFILWYRKTGDIFK